MADSQPPSGLTPTDGLGIPSPSVGDSGRPSVDDTSSRDELVPPEVAGASGRVSGGTVPHASLLSQEVPVENLTDATNQPLVSLTPQTINSRTIREKPELAIYNDLAYWPPILQWQAVLSLVGLYSVTLVGIGLLLWKSLQNPTNTFQLSSENVHLIARYLPAIVGTVTVIFFRQTVRQALRMVPFVEMADQEGEEPGGSRPWRGVGGAWFPWQSITTTPTRMVSIFSLLCQFVVSFIVSFKVALLASTQYIDRDKNAEYWSLTVRFWPAVVLISGYALMIIYTVYIALKFRTKSTGLKWNPVSIADYAALFTACNALEYFAPLELWHHLRPKHVMVPDRRFRLGYWARRRKNKDPDIVYGIGVEFNLDTDFGSSSRRQRENLGHPWQHMLTFGREKNPPLPMGQCNKPGKCAQGTYPRCEHFPYNHNPGCPQWVIILASVLCISTLGLWIYGFFTPLPYIGFSLSNDLHLPGRFQFGFGTPDKHLPPLDPTDPNSNVFVWALIFRSAPTYIAGLFTSTVVEWIDLNMRFMQPFRNMFGEEPEKKLETEQERKSFRQRLKDFFSSGHSSAVASENTSRSNGSRISAQAADSILLEYITTSPLQVPLTAWSNSHYKVCIYSTLNTLSPIFPILVGGLLIVAQADNYERVECTVSFSAYIGILISLVLYSALLPAATPGKYRLLPRQLYSLADLMAMCHESKFMASPNLDITDPDKTPSKQHMEARILLTDGRFLFGMYRGRDGKQHLGFDITQEREGNWGEVKTEGLSVKYIPPGGLPSTLKRTVTSMMEQGRSMRKGFTNAMTGRKGSNFSGRPPNARLDEQHEGIEMTEAPLMRDDALGQTSGSMS